MQSNNQLTDNISSVGCMNCLYVCLCAKFEILQTTCCLWVVHALRKNGATELLRLQADWIEWMWIEIAKSNWTNLRI
jgi:hypothetical protein